MEMIAFCAKIARSYLKRCPNYSFKFNFLCQKSAHFFSSKNIDLVPSNKCKVTLTDFEKFHHPQFLKPPHLVIWQLLHPLAVYSSLHVY